MNLYVRSQDRKRLIPNPNFYVVWDEENNIAYIGDITVGHIAKYKTEERALEVLDEIQRFYEGNANNIGTDEWIKFVYKMPKE